MYVSNRYSSHLGKWLDELSFLLMSPSLTLANHFASCYVSTIYDKQYPQYKLLDYFIFGPIYATLLTAVVPFGVIGGLIWLYLCCSGSQNKYTYVSFQETDALADNECRNVFTFASANVLLAPELLGRINNVKGAYSRAVQIAERILEHTGKHVHNIEEKGILMSKHSSVKAQFPSVDFLCLQEVWERSYSLALIDKLKEEFPYFMYDVGDYSFKTNFCMLGSGLFFASKKPIIDADFKAFTLRTKHAKYTSQGILCTKILLHYDKDGTRHVGYIANVHTQAYQGTEAVIVSQLSEILVFVAMFKKCTKELGDVVDFDVICGDFNADNMSPGDAEVQDHILFEKYCDVCMKHAGEDENWAIGTELRQQMLFKPDVSDPHVFREMLIDDALRRHYVLDADVLVHSSSLVTTLLNQSLNNSIKAVSYGGMRRIDRILFKKKSNIEVIGYCFLSSLTNLTDHIPVCMTIRTNVGEESCGSDSKAYMAKWKNIRDNFLRSIRKKVRSGQGVDSGRRYIYARQLSFLLKQGNLADTQISIAEVENGDHAQAGEQRRLEDFPNNNSTSSPKERPEKRRRNLEDTLIAFMKTPTPPNVPAPEPNDDRSFFESLIPIVSTFTIDQKLDFRSAVLDLVKKYRLSNMPTTSQAQLFSIQQNAPGNSQQRFPSLNQSRAAWQNPLHVNGANSPMSNTSTSTVNSFEDSAESMDLFSFP